MTDYDRIAKVISYIEKHFLDQPSLKKLASVAGLSESHFHRLFTKWARVTPKDFLKFITAEHAKHLLEDSADLLEASMASGLSGPSRLHDLLVTVEAVSPGEYKSKGRGITISYGFHETPFGTCLLGLTDRGLCYLSFCDGQREEALLELQEKWKNAETIRDQVSTKEAANTIFGKTKSKSVSLLLMGSSFQIKVWEALLRIPDGQLRSYLDIAEAIGSPNSSRAVGTAIGQNSLGWIIPCHRVIRASGHFSNYRWDPIRKKAMIGWEQARRLKDLP
jgi:AraC family transcriptional regulator of adaptative response/methylated-DNA-[protein]-cysteine methyltransferase